jgi:hypothetical protein
MKRKQIISLISAIAIFNMAFAAENVEAAKSHPVESTKPETTERTTETAKTVDSIKIEETGKITEVTDTKKTESKKALEAKEREKTKETKATETEKADETKKGDEPKKDTPITAQTASSISSSLPDYYAKWLNCGSNCSSSTLTYKDVLKLIEDTNITGQEAAVLAALVTYINGLNSPTSAKFTLSQLQNAFNSDTGSIYSWYYQTAIRNLNSERALPEKDKLFGRYQNQNGKWVSGISKSTQIIQNGLGDCFTLSSINGMLNHPGGPKKLEQMISPVAGHPDEFWVNFPGYPKPIYIRYTPTKLAMYSELVNGGKWLAIISDAVARARRDNPESGIFDGGYQTYILHLLTGRPYRNEALSPFTTAQVDLLKGLSDTQLNALESLLTGSNTQQLTSQLQALSTLTPEQLKAALTKDELAAFKQLTAEQLTTLQGLTAAQWNEVTTLIYSNQGSVNNKLLQRSLKANRTPQDYSQQLNQALNVDQPPHIVGIETTEHDLTVIGYNASTDTLTIKNPWGDSGWYNPVNGDGPDKNLPKNGTTPPWYNMTNGVFTANLSQLVESNFVSITIPINRSPDEIKTLVNAANEASQPGGQISTIHSKIAQAQTAMNDTKDELVAAKISAVITEANSALDQLKQALNTSKNCQTDVCQQNLANSEELAQGALNKLNLIAQ